LESEGRICGVIREEGQVHGSVAEVKSERVALRAPWEQDGAVAYAQVTKCYCRWAIVGNAADTPLEVTACHGSGVEVSGSVIEKIGLAGTRVPQGGKESSEAYPETCLPVHDAVPYADGLGMPNPEDGRGLGIGERLAAGGDEGLRAVNPDVLGQQAGDESGDGRGRAHDNVIVPVHTTNCV